MTVPFNRMPTNLRAPLFYAEVNAAPNFYAGNSRLLLIGQMLTGSATAGVPLLVQGADIDALFGRGSMICAMARIAQRNNPFGEIWALPLADAAGSAAATGSFTVSGTLTPGIAVVYVEGHRLAVPVTAADTPTTIAAAIAAAINAGYTNQNGVGCLFGVTASAALGVVTLTARNKGPLGNFIHLADDLVGDEGPNAANIAISAMTGGAGAPTLDAGLAALGSQEFDFLACPYADATSLDSLKSFLSDVGGRWDPVKGLYGWAISVNYGTLSAHATLGAARNDPHVHIVGFKSCPTPPAEVCAAIAAQVQMHKNLGAPLSQAGEISRPLQTLVLAGVRAPRLANQWTLDERNTLYFDGIGACYVAPGGDVCLDRVISTYRLNAWGSPDTTWLDIETSVQTAYALRYLRQKITQTYPRTALVSDNPNANAGFATISDIKGTVIHAYGDLVGAGVMKNKQLFADNVVVEQASDPNRVNAYLPFDVVNQLRIFAANATTNLNAAAAG